MIYFCSGYADITENEFNAHYVPQIKKIQNTDSKYILSDDNEFDFKCIKYLLSTHTNPKNIIIHSINSRSCSTLNVLPEFIYFAFVGGFFDKKDRDVYSTENSNDDIIWIREIHEIQNYNKNYTSRTYLNYLRRLKKNTLEMFK